MKRCGQLVRQGTLDTLGEVILGKLVVSILLVALQGSAVILQLHIFGTEVVTALYHLSDIGMKALHFGLEMHVSRWLPSGRLHMGGVMLSAKAIFA